MSPTAALRLLAVITILAAPSAASGSPTPAPATAPVSALHDWLALYNRHDQAELERFARARYSAGELADRPADEIAQGARVWFLNYGTMRLVSVRQTSPREAEAVVHKAGVDGCARLFVELEPRPPHRIAGVYLEPFAEVPCGERKTAVRDWADLASSLDAYAARLAAEDRFAGVVLVRRGGRTLLSRAYGARRLSPPAPNTPDTRFELASVSKLFTAAAIARLVEQGRLSLDRTVAELLPDYPNREIAARITVRQLLSHTSGLADYYRSGAALRDARPRVRPSEWWPLFAADPLQFAPGSKYDYSNSNYVLLGSIVEQVSGEPFAEFVGREVFARAGMTETCYCAPGSPGMAEPRSRHTRLAGPQRKASPDRWVVVPPDWPRPATPAGHSVSTAADLARFAEALLDHRLLGKQTLDLFLTPAADIGGPEERTLGFESARAGKRRLIGHGGFSWGVRAQLDVYPDDRTVVVILSNNEVSGMEAIRAKSRRWIAGLPPG